MTTTWWGRVRTERKAQGLTQTELADRVRQLFSHFNMVQPTISKIEKGGRKERPAVDTVYTLAVAPGVTTD